MLGFLIQCTFQPGQDGLVQTCGSGSGFVVRLKSMWGSEAGSTCPDRSLMKKDLCGSMDPDPGILVGTDFVI